ncbi:MAG: hypothetical protein FJX59_21215 [Alphaproteobacteria bacterium]|nr:hypothetical protein [Alphaproteobacteria bacterium]
MLLALSCRAVSFTGQGCLYDVDICLRARSCRVRFDQEVSRREFGPRPAGRGGWARTPLSRAEGRATSCPRSEWIHPLPRPQDGSEHLALFQSRAQSCDRRLSQRCAGVLEARQSCANNGNCRCAGIAARDNHQRRTKVSIQEQHDRISYGWPYRRSIRFQIRRQSYEGLRGRRTQDARNRSRQCQSCLRIHPIPLENGPLSVVPGTHKSNFFSPYKSNDPHLEPGMVGVQMEAGDVLIFTENLRHGGFRNLLDTPRRTLHFVNSQEWAGSISPAHYNGPMRFRRETWDAFDAAQRAMFPNAQLID